MVSGHTDVTVIGFSLSSGVAIRLMAGQPVSRLVLVAPYDSVVVVATQQFVLFSVHWPIRDRLSSASMVPSIRALTTVIVAERDEVVRPECGAGGDDRRCEPHTLDCLPAFGAVMAGAR